MAEKPPAVELFISSQCPHCASVLQSFSDLIKSADISSLQVSNLTVNPKATGTREVRTVPWFSINSLVYTGAHSPGEIKSLVVDAGRSEAITRYIGSLFQTGQMAQVAALVREVPVNINHMIRLLMGESSKLVERIGIGAVIEEFEGQAVLERIIPELGELAVHEDAKTRVDAAYYLGLTRSSKAVSILKVLAGDVNQEVTEEAEEALELIKG